MRRAVLVLLALGVSGCASLPSIAFDDGGATPPGEAGAPQDGSSSGGDATQPPGDDATAPDAASPDVTSPDAAGDDATLDAPGDDGSAADAPMDGLAPDANTCDLTGDPSGTLCCYTGEPCFGTACSNCDKCTICAAGLVCCAILNGGGKFRQATCVAPGLVNSTTCP